jgi:hypothetical protein
MKKINELLRDLSKIKTIALLMHQMRISTNLVYSQVEKVGNPIKKM